MLMMKSNVSNVESQGIKVIRGGVTKGAIIRIRPWGPPLLQSGFHNYQSSLEFSDLQYLSSFCNKIIHDLRLKTWLHTLFCVIKKKCMYISFKVCTDDFPCKYCRPTNSSHRIMNGPNNDLKFLQVNYKLQGKWLEEKRYRNPIIGCVTLRTHFIKV